MRMRTIAGKRICWVSRKGPGDSKKTGEDDLDYDTSLAHSQLQVRGGVSPPGLGQYHMCTQYGHGYMAIVSYIKIIIRFGCLRVCERGSESISPLRVY
jgi:hypothetical protein